MIKARGGQRSDRGGSAPGWPPVDNKMLEVSDQNGHLKQVEIDYKLALFDDDANANNKVV